MTELGVADVYRGSVEVVRANRGTFFFFVTFSIVANLAATIGVSAVAADVVPFAFESDSPAMFFGRAAQLLPLYLVSGVVLMVTYALAQAGMTFATVEHMAGRKATVPGALRVAFRSMLPILASSFVVGLVSGIGMMLCLVPGIVAMLLLCLTTPVILVEGLGPFASMERSSDLTDGNRGTIFLVFFALAVCVVGASAALAGPLETLFGDAPEIMTAPWLASLTLDAVSDGAITAVTTTFIAVIYARIRGIRDGMDVEAFAKVFE